MTTPRDRLIVALDVPERRRGAAPRGRASPGSVGMFKVGSQLFTARRARARARAGRPRREGLPRPQVPRHPQHGGGRGQRRLPARRLAARPSTPSAGRRCWRRRRARSPRMGARLLAITILTSHDEASLARLGAGAGRCPDSVQRLARLAREPRRLDGVVASPHEVGADPGGVRARLPDRHARDPARGRARATTRRGPPRPRRPWRRAPTTSWWAGRSRRRPTPRRPPPRSSREMVGAGTVLRRPPSRRA